MSEEEISIKINICDRFYPLRINAIEEESVRKAAGKINDRAKYYIENFSVQDRQDALAMVALEFASSLNADEAETPYDQIDDKLQNLEDLLDQ